MTHPVYNITSHRIFSDKNTGVPHFLITRRKKTAEGSRLGIKFANSLAGYLVLYISVPCFFTNYSAGLSVNNIPAVMAESGHSHSVSCVNWMVLLNKGEERNEPSVLCQSTFL